MTVNFPSMVAARLIEVDAYREGCMQVIGRGAVLVDSPRHLVLGFANILYMAGCALNEIDSVF
jgi:hypothetical protein